MSEQRYTEEDAKNFARYIEKGHVLKLDEYGRVDIFVCDADFHNGPGCEVCEDQWCWHCNERIKQCIRKEAVDAERAKWAAEHKRKTDASAAWDDIEALERRISELRSVS